jgi:hypothetical protein
VEERVFEGMRRKIGPEMGFPGISAFLKHTLHADGADTGTPATMRNAKSIVSLERIGNLRLVKVEMTDINAQIAGVTKADLESTFRSCARV